MPGAYAHLTLVNNLREPSRLEVIGGFPLDAIRLISKHLKFCELGAVSPDFPYLAFRDSTAKKWADRMHYTRTGEMIKAGVSYLRGSTGMAQDKGLAWLLGYCSHVAMDVTIHPVIELKVGPYAKNKRRHRICEMNQDVYIFKRRMNLNIGISEFLKSGIYRCADPGETDRLDKDIHKLWLHMMKQVHPDDFAKHPPDIDKWYRWFTRIVDKIAEENYRLVPFSRHVATGVAGIAYPTEGDIDFQFINGLDCPGGRALEYDEIFDMAMTNVGSVWASVASGVMEGNTAYLTRVGNWNLDTGLDEANRLVFWA